MRGWTGRGWAEVAGIGIVHVGLMIGRVQVLTVPAGREVMDGLG